MEKWENSNGFRQKFETKKGYYIAHFKFRNKKLTAMNEKSRQALQDDLDDKLIPLLHELQQLHGIKVLEGNYDLKIFRQDYFLSKQSEVSKL